MTAAGIIVPVGLILLVLLVLVTLIRRGVEELVFTRASVARIEARQIQAMTRTAHREEAGPLPGSA